MRTALIGYTGFVGSNLASRMPFDDMYNTANIEEIAGERYDLVISAANRADSFWVNQHQDADREQVELLIRDLAKAQIARLVVVSTVCVYPGDTSPDENTPLSPNDLTPYGQNRLYQEQRLQDLFETTIVRLPQLYGDKLKKGIIFDLTNDYRIEFIDPDDAFQYYDARRLSADIEQILEHRVDAVNMASPALSNTRIAREVFNVDLSSNEARAKDPFASMYTRDMRSIHASFLGGRDGYMANIEAELDSIKSFVEDSTSRRR